MKIDRNQLTTILKSIQPGLASKEVLEQTTSFIMLDGQIATYNDEIAVHHPFDLGDIRGAVKADEFFKLLNRYKANELEIEVEGGQIIVKTKTSKAGIAMSAEVKVPLDEMGMPDKWHKLPEDFMEGLDKCLFTCGEDLSRPVLTYIYVNGNNVYSTDNNRATKFTMTKKAGKPLFIPGRVVKHLQQYKPDTIGFTEGWLHFQNEAGVVFSHRTFSGDYLDVEKVFGVVGQKITLPEGMEEAVDRADVFVAGLPTPLVTMTAKDGRLVLEGSNENGFYKEKFPIDKAVEFSCHIQPGFLKDCLKLKREITLSDSLLKMEGEKFSHVTRLIIMGS